MWIIAAAIVDHAAAIFLLLPCTSVPAAIRRVEMLCFVEFNLWLILHNTELTNPVVYMDFSISQCIRREEPLIIIAAI